MVNPLSGSAHTFSLQEMMKERKYFVPPVGFDKPRPLGKNRAMTIVDCHTHILPAEIVAQRERLLEREPWFGLLYANPCQRLAMLPDLLTAMDAAGVDQAVAFGFAFVDMGLCRLANDYVLEAAQKSGGRIVPFAVVNPLAGEEAIVEARRCLEAGARGLGELMPDGQGFSLEGDALGGLAALARAYDAPMLLHVNEPVGHTYAGKGTQGPTEAYALAVRYPENAFLLAHWGGGLPFYELMPEVKAALARVYYDTAASPYLYEDAIYRHVSGWAARKVLFGSDFPLLAPKRCLERFRRLGLGAEIERQILYENAARLLGLSEAPKKE